MFSVGEPLLHQGIGTIRGRRRYNRAVLLELVRCGGPISKPELARLAGLKFPVVSAITDELVEEGLVEENGLGPSTGGRPPALFGLRADARYAMGIDVGTRTLRAVVTNLNAAVASRVVAPSEMAKGRETLFARVRDTLEQLLDKVPEMRGKILGIGLALPAPIFDFRGRFLACRAIRGGGSCASGNC